MGGMNYKNQRLPPNLCRIGYDQNTRSAFTSSAFLDRIYHVLGVKSRKLPKNFRGKFKVDGHNVVVFPSRLTMGKYVTKKVSGRKYGLSRVFFLLGRGKLVPVGRIHQSKHCGGRGGRYYGGRGGS